MNDREMSRILGNVKRSMEMEGFSIDESLMKQGEKILRGEERTEDVVARYASRARELGAKFSDSHAQ